MKKALLLLLGILILSCNYQTKSASNIDKEKKVDVSFDWLLGNWVRTNNEEGKITYESWEKINVQSYKGIGYTIQKQDTISMEDMWINKSGDIWQLEVLAPGETSITVFKITDHKEKHFIAENQENEFPKKIAYNRSGDILKAIVSNPDFEILFDFMKISKLTK